MPKGVKKTFDEWVDGFKKYHGDLFEYKRVFRKNNRSYVTFFCKKHRLEFTQRTENLLGNKGNCCINCAKEAVSKKKRIGAKGFHKKAVLTHGDKYDYSMVKGNVSWRSRVDIICPDHGVFKQLVRDHIGVQASGCPDCYRDVRGNYWIKDKWVSICNERDATLYFLRCFDENENFYKVGITVNKIKERFAGNTIPYNYEVLLEIKDSPEIIHDLESFYKKKLNKYRYKPKKVFAGSKYECFTKISSKC
jgi:hypothetical protein